MTARVNLLPDDTRADAGRARQRGIGLGAVLVILLIFGGLYFLQLQQVEQAREELADEQFIEAGLRNDLAELAAFDDLNQRLQDADALAQQSLASQVTVAGILQDIAAVMPADSALTSMSVDVSGAGTPEPGLEAPVYGRVTLSGESLGGHAPGVERVLLAFEKVAAFRSIYFTSSNLDEGAEELPGVDQLSVFSMDFDLGPEVLTQRYADGLPEVQR
jgi:hypothetical protein